MAKFYPGCSMLLLGLLLLTGNMFAQVVPTIKGPLNEEGMPASIGPGITTAVYSTEAGMTNYKWAVSAQGTITLNKDSIITVVWTNPTGHQTVSVTYDENTSGEPTVLLIAFYPFQNAINPATIPQFVDPLPHFAAGLRVDARNGGNLIVKTFPVQQIALSKGTLVTGGTIGDPATPDAGKGNYVGYGISTDDGQTFPYPMWPARTIETQQGKPLTVKYENGLAGIKYDQFNILADQTLMMNGYNLTGNPLTEPYSGDIPMVVHLHGGEMPSGSDGGPNAWFMPGFTQTGPAFKFNQSSSSYYPNAQEAATLWYHPHDDGLTRINVYTGLAGYYILRGENEEAAKLPGWSQDDLVMENTPAGDKYSPTFNGTKPYLPEIEIAIQDRMFNVDGGLYWPVDPPNPEIHPFWTPEFIGNVMTVNGKSWPYLSVAPRKYRFRILEGCNARFLDMWLAVVDPVSGDQTGFGPAFNIIGGEGGLLETPEIIDPSGGKTLLMAPGQRYDVIIDFSGYAPGTVFTLMNKAGSPYPDGDPVEPGITDRIMQFIVNGEMVSAADHTVAGTDKSLLPSNLRPVNPLVKLTDFAGGTNVTPDVHRQIVLNEVSAEGGPAAVLVNNTYFDAALSINPAEPYRAGGPSELQTEGTTEKFEVINVSADAHPIHIHLLQWQLVSRRPIDATAYLNAYAQAWQDQHPDIAEFPAGLGYPGGAGTPFPYSQLNSDQAIGGNPGVSQFFTGPAVPAKPEERGWKDNIIVMPGEVTTFMVRVAPTDKPLNASQKDLLFPFDPSEGPGYVWHCHIIDHEDMSMMRPLPILPSPERYPSIVTQPAAVNACAGDASASITISATSSTGITYQWEVSTDNGTTFTALANNAVYSGVTLSTLKIVSTVNLSENLYRCQVTNFDGTTTSASALLTVNNCTLSGTVKYNNTAQDPLPGVTVSVNGLTAVTDAAGAYLITGVTSGTYPVIITNTVLPGGVNATDAGSVNSWVASPAAIQKVKYLAGDVDKLSLSSLDAQAIQKNFVSGTAFAQTPWVYSDLGTTTTVPAALPANIQGNSVTGFNILAMSTGDFNSSFRPGVAGVSGLVFSSSGSTLSVPVSLPFKLGIKSVTALQAGAISLMLNVPSTLVTINNVTIPGSTVQPVWNFSGNVLKIAWNSTTPLNVPAGGNLIELNLTPTTAFSSSQTLKITMTASYLNEIADGIFNTVPGATLTVDIVKTTVKTTISAALLLTVAPNPAAINTSITINYTLPAAGYVTLGIYDNKGVQLKSLINNQYMDVLTNTLTYNLTGLIKGNYYLKITYIDGGPAQTNTVKLMIK